MVYSLPPYIGLGLEQTLRSILVVSFVGFVLGQGVGLVYLALGGLNDSGDTSATGG
jgi:hypothetical protein